LRQVFRGELIYTIGNKIRLRGRFEYNTFQIAQTGDNENGYLVFQDVRYSPSNNFNLYGRIIFFKTDSFVLQFMNMKITDRSINERSFIRWRDKMVFFNSVQPHKILTVSAKYSETYKPANKSLGSGDSSIPGNLDNIVSLQLDLTYSRINDTNCNIFFILFFFQYSNSLQFNIFR